MKLILSFSLIWMLFSTTGALMCLDSSSNSTKSCESSEYCSAADVHGSPGNQQLKSCVSSSFCNLKENKTISFNIGFYSLTASVYCCNYTTCTNMVTHQLEIPSNSSLRCFTCKGTLCKEKLTCNEKQDRCISVEVKAGNKTMSAYGCASKNLCETTFDLPSFLPSDVNFTSTPKCCQSNLCNSAWTVKPNAVSSMLRLLMLMFFLNQ